MEKKMIPISHDDYVKGKWKSVSSSSGEHEAKIWLNDDGSIDAEASYSDSYCRKHQLGRYAPKADSSSSTSSSSSSHSSKAEKSHNKELAKMENETELLTYMTSFLAEMLDKMDSWEKKFEMSDSTNTEDENITDDVIDEMTDDITTIE
jgi:hypothetical protein